MKVLLFDNYDSFTYNLLHILKDLNVDTEVHRNDKITLYEVDRFDKILLSPGPGIPEEAGLLIPLLKSYASTKSMLGVCLGMQAMAEVFGGKLINLAEVSHGVCSDIRMTVSDPIFEGLPRCFSAGRYHSWAVSKDGLPDSLEIIAEDLKDGCVMAIRHKTYRLHGVQFHPESILTPQGKIIIENWLRL